MGREGGKGGEGGSLAQTGWEERRKTGYGWVGLGGSQGGRKRGCWQEGTESCIERPPPCSGHEAESRVRTAYGGG